MKETTEKNGYQELLQDLETKTSQEKAELQTQLDQIWHNYINGEISLLEREADLIFAALEICQSARLELKLSITDRDGDKVYGRIHYKR